jgi:hypothetical protein
MLGLSGFTAVRKMNTGQSISDMQALIHGWNTPTVGAALVLFLPSQFSILDT